MKSQRTTIWSKKSPSPKLSQPSIKILAKMTDLRFISRFSTIFSWEHRPTIPARHQSQSYPLFHHTRDQTRSWRRKMRRQVQNEPYIFIGDDELMTEADKKKEIEVPFHGPVTRDDHPNTKRWKNSRKRKERVKAIQSFDVKMLWCSVFIFNRFLLS